MLRFVARVPNRPGLVALRGRLNPSYVWVEGKQGQSPAEAMMPVTKSRPSVASRRFGYILAAAITVGMWFVINEWPGWQELSFLTDETRAVLGLVNFSLAVSLLVNLIYLVYDPVWFKSVGDVITTSVGPAILGSGRCSRSTSAITPLTGLCWRALFSSWGLLAACLLYTSPSPRDS